MSGPSQVLDTRARRAEWWLSLDGMEWALALLTSARNAVGEAIDKGRTLLADLERRAAAGEISPLEAEEAHAQITEALNDPARFDFEDRRGMDPEEMLTVLAERGGRLRRAEAYWVAPDMVALTDAAYPSRPQVPLTPDTVPASGFVQLATPSGPLGSDIGPTMSELAWHRDAFTDSAGRVRTGVRLIYWMPRAALLRIMLDTLEPWERVRPERWAVLQDAVPFAEFWEFGLPSPSGPGADVAMEHAAQWAHAFWTLSQQPISVTQTVPADRGARRRAERAGVSGNVTVVTLRRTHTDSGHGDSNREYSHRWVVRGFWRNQWYPSLGQHRPIWIDDYIKGPQDRPLLVKERVFAWRR